MKTGSEVIAEAMQMLTLEEALVHVMRWETERAVAQALEGKRGPDGQLFDTCISYLIKTVVRNFVPVNER